QAQACKLSNIKVELNSATPSGGNCLVDMDITFDMEDNTGNKYIWINLWKSADYPFINFDYNASSAKGPKLSEIDGADHTHPPIAVIGIDNSTTATYLTNYSPDPTNITPKTGTSITNVPVGTVSHFVLSHVTFTVPGGCAGLILQGDVWSTNANSSTPAIHCASKGISFYGDPTIGGIINCTFPRTFQVILHTVSINPITVNYKVYIDNGVFGTKEAGDPLIYTSSSPISISASTPYTLAPTQWVGNQNAGAMLVELNVLTPFSKTIYGDIVNSCATLPVTFKSFTATRNHSNVLLKWETALEQNNSGFYIERNISGTWEQVAFVPSLAAGGNSSSDLSYQYTDLNNVKGITQYRLRQVDFDTKSKYSDVRAVRGDGQAGKTVVYPNPSYTGKVSVVFEDATVTRNVFLSDMSGRMINRWKAVTANNIQIDNLTPGMYSLRIVVPETGEQSVEKIIVSNR
ncbi:MAG: T9SS type A sorting domain-containing protein, partial [Bacteroidia bacterium]|nr:T9SS type A sorting domain-containing protein [Bacteroidia bacterium]